MMDWGFTGVGLMPNLGDARMIERLRGIPNQHDRDDPL